MGLAKGDTRNLDYSYMRPPKLVKKVSTDPGVDIGEPLGRSILNPINPKPSLGRSWSFCCEVLHLGLLLRNLSKLAYYGYYGYMSCSLNSWHAP